MKQKFELKSLIIVTKCAILLPACGSEKAPNTAEAEPIGDLWVGSWDVRLWALEPAAVLVHGVYAVGLISLSFLVLKRRDV